MGVSNVAGIIIQGFITGWNPLPQSLGLGQLFSKTRSDRLPVNENDKDIKVIEENIDDKSTTKTNLQRRLQPMKEQIETTAETVEEAIENRTKRTRRRAAPNRSKRR
ncbi:MAG: hypothetical protein CM1200mP38_8480 [Dehalococcoidia bacterium]|nr:MAG: hypothetical protein CM1200mP38_8480 [Dehalococcoidia bacterium]